MTTPNRATVWGRLIVDELAASGIEAVCITPGSRSTPLTVACWEHPDLTVYSHLDERASAFFALGHARRTGTPSALVCTSGTAAANFHPAIVEADTGRVPLVALTADRPRELRDSGANQTIDQVDLYGDAVRASIDLPEPRVENRAMRSLRRSVCVALNDAMGPPAGPVHLNCPFAKPLEPIEVEDDHPAAVDQPPASGQDGPFVSIRRGTTSLDETTVETVVTDLEEATRPLVVVGPTDPGVAVGEPIATIADDLEAPVFADPLSGVRFHPDAASLVAGGYDGYVEELPAPDVVLRVGAAPTSAALEEALEASDARQFLLDPAGEWRAATFSPSELLIADEQRALERIGERISTTNAAESWRSAIDRAERAHWSVRDDALEERALDVAPFEGAVLARVFDDAPDTSTIVVSNSMPMRDADRFARPRSADLTVLGNRGASGVDGVTSTALGAGSATADPLVLVIGDLAFYHDATGLLAIERCGVDATIVLIDNDGGGIFHMLPIESVDPPFTEQFKTPHGLEFEHLADLYDLAFETVPLPDFATAYQDSLEQSETQVIRVALDAAASHKRRDELQQAVARTLADSGPERPPDGDRVAEGNPEEREGQRTE